MTTADCIQLGVGLITLVGILAAINANKKQLQILNQQLKLNFFTDYTKRYQEIILNFPENINESSFDYSVLEKDVKHKTLRYMRAYFDLCSEEFYLNQRSYIDDSIWLLWEGGITFALSKKAFQDAWDIINKDTKHGVNFELWVKNVINNSK